MRFKAHLRVSAGIEEEGCLLCGQVDVIIVGELRQGEECVPVVLSFLELKSPVWSGLSSIFGKTGTRTGL